MNGIINHYSIFCLFIYLSVWLLGFPFLGDFLKSLFLEPHHLIVVVLLAILWGRLKCIPGIHGPEPVRGLDQDRTIMKFLDQKQIFLKIWDQENLVNFVPTRSNAGPPIARVNSLNDLRSEMTSIE